LNETIKIISTMDVKQESVKTPPAVPSGQESKPSDTKPSDAKKDEKKEEKKDDKSAVKDNGPKKEEPVKKLYCN
jgi:hypothetical protein